MDSREYDQLDALSSSSNMEISRLSVIIKNLKERLESLERNQTDMMDKINAFEREKTGQQDQKAAEVVGSNNPARSISSCYRTGHFIEPYFRCLICPMLFYESSCNAKVQYQFTGISTPIFREYRSHNSSSFEQIQCHDRGDEDNNESASSDDDSLLVAIVVPSDWSNFAKQTKARLDIGIAFPSQGVGQKNRG